MDIKYLNFRTEIKSNDKGEATAFEAYGSTFGNVDSYDDVVMKGAFLDTLNKRTPKILYQHDTSRVAGIMTAAEEDDKGLLIRGEFLNTTLGRDVREEVKSGAIDSMSIGFSIKEAEYDDRGVRFIRDVELYEISFVTFPANEQAIVTSVKTDGVKTIREYEIFLRDAGFSKNDSKRFALYGFKTSEEIERDARDSELKEALNNLNNKFKGDI